MRRELQLLHWKTFSQPRAQLKLWKLSSIYYSNITNWVKMARIGQSDNMKTIAIFFKVSENALRHYEFWKKNTRTKAQAPLRLSCRKWPCSTNMIVFHFYIYIILILPLPLYFIICSIIPICPLHIFCDQTNQLENILFCWKVMWLCRTKTSKKNLFCTKH